MMRLVIRHRYDDETNETIIINEKERSKLRFVRVEVHCWKGQRGLRNCIRLTDKFDTILLEKMRIILTHVPSGDLYKLGYMLDTCYAATRTHHVCHASGEITRA